MLLGEFGFAASVTYFSARDINFFRQANILRKCMAFSSIFSLLISFFAFCVAAFTDWTAMASNDAFIFVAVPLCICFVVLPRALLQSLNSRLRNFARLSQSISYFLAIAIGSYERHLTVKFALLSIVCSLAFEGLMVGIFLYTVDKDFETRHDRSTKAHGIVGFATASFLTTLPIAITVTLDQSLMSFLSNPEQLGIYALATSIAMAPVAAIASLGQVLFPHVARSGATSADSLLWRRSLKLSSSICLIWGAMASLFLTFSSIETLRSEYSLVPILLLILAPGSAALCAVYVLTDIIRGLGYPKQTSRVHIGGSLITAISLGVLLPKYGSVGAAFASSFSYLVICFFLIKTLSRLLKAGNSLEIA